MYTTSHITYIYHFLLQFSHLILVYIDLYIVYSHSTQRNFSMAHVRAHTHNTYVSHNGLARYIVHNIYNNPFCVHSHSGISSIYWTYGKKKKQKRKRKSWVGWCVRDYATCAAAAGLALPLLLGELSRRPICNRFSMFFFFFANQQVDGLQIGNID